MYANVSFDLGLYTNTGRATDPLPRASRRRRQRRRGRGSRTPKERSGGAQGRRKARRHRRAFACGASRRASSSREYASVTSPSCARMRAHAADHVVATPSFASGASSARTSSSPSFRRIPRSTTRACTSPSRVRPSRAWSSRPTRRSLATRVWPRCGEACALSEAALPRAVLPTP